jgi:undecaprenyl-diphosphatase
MGLITVKPTKPDIAIAHAVARNARPAPEEVTAAVTWGADEKLLLVLAVAGWIGLRGRGESLRRAGNHVLLVTVAASLLPHVLKLNFDQKRPDRRTIVGHVHGIPISGKPNDAFPSGHALHMGALASLASTLPPGQRAATRLVAAGLSFTRILLLAHWASDVVAGFVLGVGLERVLRLWTGYPPGSTCVECTTIEDRHHPLKTIPKVSLPRKDPVYRVAGPLPKPWRRTR